ncbi:pentapeptide repeat-containing protein [Thiotrichales bacterium 19S11-10]|nr:pentapeptide repeat-containing protein [Thiotrichales bacterium 19S11-10]
MGKYYVGLKTKLGPELVQHLLQANIKGIDRVVCRTPVRGGGSIEDALNGYNAQFGPRRIIAMPHDHEMPYRVVGKQGGKSWDQENAVIIPMVTGVDHTQALILFPNADPNKRKAVFFDSKGSKLTLEKELELRVLGFDNVICTPRFQYDLGNQGDYSEDYLVECIDRITGTGVDYINQTLLNNFNPRFMIDEGRQIRGRIISEYVCSDYSNKEDIFINQELELFIRQRHLLSQSVMVSIVSDEGVKEENIKLKREGESKYVENLQQNSLVDDKAIPSWQRVKKKESKRVLQTDKIKKYKKDIAILEARKAFLESKKEHLNDSGVLDEIINQDPEIQSYKGETEALINLKRIFTESDFGAIRSAIKELPIEDVNLFSDRRSNQEVLDEFVTWLPVIQMVNSILSKEGYSKFSDVINLANEYSELKTVFDSLKSLKESMLPCFRFYKQIEPYIEEAYYHFLNESDSDVTVNSKFQSIFRYESKFLETPSSASFDSIAEELYQLYQEIKSKEKKNLLGRNIVSNSRGQLLKSLKDVGINKDDFKSLENLKIKIRKLPLGNEDETNFESLYFGSSNTLSKFRGKSLEELLSKNQQIVNQIRSMLNNETLKQLVDKGNEIFDTVKNIDSLRADLEDQISERVNRIKNDLAPYVEDEIRKLEQEINKNKQALDNEIIELFKKDQGSKSQTLYRRALNFTGQGAQVVGSREGEFDSYWNQLFGNQEKCKALHDEIEGINNKINKLIEDKTGNPGEITNLYSESIAKTNEMAEIIEKMHKQFSYAIYQQAKNNQPVIIPESIRSLNFSGFDLSEVNLHFIQYEDGQPFDFQYSNFDGAKVGPNTKFPESMAYCNLSGIIFIGEIITFKGIDFSGAALPQDLRNIRFEDDCSVEDVSFDSVIVNENTKLPVSATKLGELKVKVDNKQEMFSLNGFEFDGNNGDSLPKDLRNVDLTGAIIKNINLTDHIIDHTTRLNKVTFDNVSFNGCRIEGANFDGCIFNQVVFNTEIKRSAFGHSTFNFCQFHRCNIEAVYGQCEFQGETVFSESVNLSRSRFENTTFDIVVVSPDIQLPQDGHDIVVSQISPIHPSDDISQVVRSSIFNSNQSAIARVTADQFLLELENLLANYQNDSNKDKMRKSARSWVIDNAHRLIDIQACEVVLERLEDWKKGVDDLRTDNKDMKWRLFNHYTESIHIENLLSIERSKQKEEGSSQEGSSRPSGMTNRVVYGAVHRQKRKLMAQNFEAVLPVEHQFFQKVFTHFKPSDDFFASQTDKALFDELKQGMAVFPNDFYAKYAKANQAVMTSLAEQKEKLLSSSGSSSSQRSNEKVINDLSPTFQKHGKAVSMVVKLLEGASGEDISSFVQTLNITDLLQLIKAIEAHSKGVNLNNSPVVQEARRKLNFIGKVLMLCIYEALRMAFSDERVGYSLDKNERKYLLKLLAFLPVSGEGILKINIPEDVEDKQAYISDYIDQNYDNFFQKKDDITAFFDLNVKLDFEQIVDRLDELMLNFNNSLMFHDRDDDKKHERVRHVFLQQFAFLQKDERKRNLCITGFGSPDDVVGISSDEMDKWVSGIQVDKKSAKINYQPLPGVTEPTSSMKSLLVDWIKPRAQAQRDKKYVQQIDTFVRHIITDAVKEYLAKVNNDVERVNLRLGQIATKKGEKITLPKIFVRNGEVCILPKDVLFSLETLEKIMSKLFLTRGALGTINKSEEAFYNAIVRGIENQREFFTFISGREMLPRLEIVGDLERSEYTVKIVVQQFERYQQKESLSDTRTPYDRKNITRSQIESKLNQLDRSLKLIQEEEQKLHVDKKEIKSKKVKKEIVSFDQLKIDQQKGHITARTKELAELLYKYTNNEKDKYVILSLLKKSEIAKTGSREVESLVRNIQEYSTLCLAEVAGDISVSDKKKLHGKRQELGKPSLFDMFEKSVIASKGKKSEKKLNLDRIKEIKKTSAERKERTFSSEEMREKRKLYQKIELKFESLGKNLSDLKEKEEKLVGSLKDEVAKHYKEGISQKREQILTQIKDLADLLSQYTGDEDDKLVVLSYKKKIEKRKEQAGSKEIEQALGKIETHVNLCIKEVQKELNKEDTLRLGFKRNECREKHKPSIVPDFLREHDKSLSSSSKSQQGLSKLTTLGTNRISAPSSSSSSSQPQAPSSSNLRASSYFQIGRDEEVPAPMLIAHQSRSNSMQIDSRFSISNLNPFRKKDEERQQTPDSHSNNGSIN